MTARRLTVVMGLFAIALAGCPRETPQKPVAQPYLRPELEFTAIDFGKRSFQAMTVSWKFTLTSRDSRPAPLAGCDWKLTIEGLEPFSGQAQVPPRLEGQARVTVMLSQELPWPETPEELVEFLSRQRLPYQLEVHCRVDWPGQPEVVTAGDSGSLPLPRIPVLKMAGANAERFSGKEFKLNFEITLVNENTFPVRVRQITYQIAAEGLELAVGSLPVEEYLAPNSETTYEIGSGMLSVASDPQVAPLLTKSQLSYTLKGMVEYEHFQVPVLDQGVVSFPR